MEKKEIVLTVAKDLLVAAISNGKINLDIGPIGGDKAMTALGDRFKVLVDKVNSIYADLS